MAFSNYKNLAFVMKTFKIKYEKQNYLKETEFPVKQDFKDELELLFTDGVIDNSEYALCENLIYPVLKEGWGQCLAEMIAVQKLNQTPEKSVFGIVCNGEIWQFGKLHLDVFTKNKKNYQIQELDELFGAVNFIFQQCDIDNM